MTGPRGATSAMKTLVMRIWLVGTRSLRGVNTEWGMLPALVALVFPNPFGSRKGISCPCRWLRPLPNSAVEQFRQARWTNNNVARIIADGEKECGGALLHASEVLTSVPQGKCER